MPEGGGGGEARRVRNVKAKGYEKITAVSFVRGQKPSPSVEESGGLGSEEQTSFPVCEPFTHDDYALHCYLQCNGDSRPEENCLTETGDAINRRSSPDARREGRKGCMHAKGLTARAQKSPLSSSSFRVPIQHCRRHAISCSIRCVSLSDNEWRIRRTDGEVFWRACLSAGP